MTQLSLTLPPRSHASDPETSREVEARSAPMRGRHLGDVLALVTEYPGSTGEELARLAGAGFAADDHVRLYQVRRRLSDLRLAGLVLCGEKREGQVTWWRTR